MKKKHCYKVAVIAVGLFALLRVNAQQQGFKFKASVDTVSVSQFYKIALAPSITSKCLPTLQDIHIVDENGKQVAYILKQQQGVETKSQFTSFAIISNKKESDKQVHITVENKQANTISKLWVITSNTDAKRLVDVTGSNNQKDWFIIKEKLPFNNAINTKETTTAYSIDLPLSGYKYYQIVFIGKDVLPPNILNVGVYSNDYVSAKNIDNPKPIISQKDSSNKYTYVQLQLNAPHQIDELEITISGVKFYRRLMSVYTSDSKHPIFVQNNYVSSDASLTFPINTHACKLLLAIDNEDNQPLKIEGVITRQLHKYLLTYLEANKQYTLQFGNSNALVPKYDLGFFKDSIADFKTATVNIGNIIEITPQANTLVPTKNNKKALLIWIAIGTVLIILLLMVKKMLQQLHKKDSSL
ncbi:MAG: hypothetical protein QM541_07550 [Flavobacterium sp.]|nr:hypothetical protein [Flavobacterium sp.]